MTDLIKDSQQSKVRSLLRGLIGTTDAGVNAAAAITSDGMIIASILAEGANAERFAAMSASLLALAEREIEEIERGELVQLMIEGTKGAVLLVQAGPDSVLAVSTNPNAVIGKIFIEARKTAMKMRDVLQQ